MATDVEALYRLIYRPDDPDGARFTQDSPILPDVWVQLAQRGRLDARVPVLLIPHHRTPIPRLVDSLSTVLGRAARSSLRPIANESHVLVELTLAELLALLPLTSWWEDLGLKAGPHRDLRGIVDVLLKAPPQRLLAWLDHDDGADRPIPAPLMQLLRIAAAVTGALTHDGVVPRGADAWADALKTLKTLVTAARTKARAVKPRARPARIWRASVDRTARPSLARSVATIKGDAARRLFRMSCDGLIWAVVDSGVDATHPAFGRYRETQFAGTKSIKPTASRVTRTFDFTRLKALLRTETVDTEHSAFATLDQQARDELMDDLRRRLLRGQFADWNTLRPFLEIPAERYVVPTTKHGTHVAGILAADWRLKPAERAEVEGFEEGDLVGVCPDLELFDVRVFDADGSASEFVLIAALQFLRYLNQSKDKRVVHGANLSFSLPHHVRDYGCGRTPICEEANRLVDSGVVVVGAAGNAGYSDAMVASSGLQSYTSASVTDPGNAAGVITVGSVHRHMPHAYGVSYFSSRGPTGDGRLKPDLVAPGEKITAPIPGAAAGSLDGTSMAAPHVSGAAALLMARHPELVGDPDTIKSILCSTATDLGRERYFQGAGLVDVLRAIQSR